MWSPRWIIANAFYYKFCAYGSYCVSGRHLHEADNFSFQILRLSSVEAIYSHSRAEDAWPKTSLPLGFILVSGLIKKKAKCLFIGTSWPESITGPLCLQTSFLPAHSLGKMFGSWLSTLLPDAVPGHWGKASAGSSRRFWVLAYDESEMYSRCSSAVVCPWWVFWAGRKFVLDWGLSVILHSFEGRGKQG